MSEHVTPAERPAALLAEVEALLNSGMTPGPWEVERQSSWGITNLLILDHERAEGTVAAVRRVDAVDDANFALIAAAPTLLARLAAALRASEATVQRVRRLERGWRDRATEVLTLLADTPRSSDALDARNVLAAADLLAAALAPSDTEAPL